MRAMTPTALALALTAALVHAVWNQVLAGSANPAARSAVGMIVACLVAAPLALVGLRWEPEVWPLAAASVACELAYFVALSTAYRVAPLGVVYPVARGSAPVLVLLVGWVALGQAVAWYAAAGVALVVAGVLLVGGPRRDVRVRHVVLAVGVGACIAAYTLIDSVALEHASPLALLVVVLGTTALVQAGAIATRTGVGPLVGATLRGPDAWRTLVAGFGILGAYGLVLLALTDAPAAPVAAVRETSVVMVVLLLALTGRERLTPARLGGAVAVAAGVALVVL